MSNQISRRKFIKTAAFGAAGVVVLPQFLASCKESKGSSADDGIIRLGFIGLGQQAMYLMSGFIGMQDVLVVAGCDVYGIKRERFMKRAMAHYAGTDQKVDAVSYTHLEPGGERERHPDRDIHVRYPLPAGLQQLAGPLLLRDCRAPCRDHYRAVHRVLHLTLV